MKKAKLLILSLLTMLGMGTASAETVAPYSVDFNTAISTSVHDFAVASNWGHIVPASDYDGYGPYYMSYSYSSTSGIDGSGALLAYRQYAGDYSGGEVIKDYLVTPKVEGEVKLYVQASGLASSSNPSFVEFYTVNDAGTEAGDLIQRFDADTYVADEAIEGWSYVTLNLSSAQRLAIRAQFALLDNFSATSAEILPERKLTITGLTSVEGGTYYVSQNADGTADVQLKVTLKNTGDADLQPGDENYTLSLVKKAYYGSTQTIYDAVTFAIDQAIKAGESATIVASFTAPSDLGTGWMYLKVKENISDNISSAQVQTQVQEYASKFIFDKAETSYYSSSTSTTTPISFGKINEATTLEYEIYNSGSAPLAINSFTLPEGFTSDAPAGAFTVAGGEKKVIAITLGADVPGIFAGDLVINYTNYGKEAADYTLGISGTVVDASKNLITFDNGENGQFPAGSIHSDQVYISYNSSTENYFLQSTSTTTKFITPLLTAAAGESFTYDSWYNSYSSTAKVTVYTSTDRINWTQVDQQQSRTISSTPATFTVTIEEAGDYYLAFELEGNALLDDIYGLTLAAEQAHDWYVMGSDIPTTGKQNNPYTATIDVKNIKAEADVIETATLYVDGKAVATQENVALEGNEKTAAVGTGRNNYSNIEDPVTVTFTIKPHMIGEVPAYIELKSGDKVVKTEEVIVNIAEEKTESELAIGTKNSNTNQAPFYGFDMESGAYADMYLSKQQLLDYGLKAGDKINAITFKGSASKTISQLKAEAWVGTEEDGSFVAGQVNKDNMTHVVIYDDERVEFTAPTSMTIDLAEAPIVWDGEQQIRIFTYINGNGNWISFNWESDTSYPQQAYYSKSETTWSTTSYKESPVAYLSLEVEEMTLSGVVTDAATEEPIEGATVTIRNDENDVEYFATTDAEGNYTMNVVQNALTYDATVEAEGYNNATAEGLDFSNESLTENFALESDKEYIIANISESGYATLYYADKTLIVPDGVTANTAELVAGENGKKSLTLTPIEDAIIPAGTPVILKGEQGEYEFEVNKDEIGFNDPIDEPMLDGAKETWKADGETAVTANATYVDSELAKVETVYAGTLKKDGKEGQTFSGESFTHYIQVRVKADPKMNNDGTIDANGTDNGGSTPLVITAKKDMKLKVYYRRQSTGQTDDKGTYASNDGKDLKCYDRSDVSVLDGVMTIDKESADGKYGWGTKEYELKAGKAYTLAARGTTIQFYGFTMEEIVSEEPAEELTAVLVGTENGGTIDAVDGEKLYVLRYADENKDPNYVGFYYQFAGGTKVEMKAHQAYLSVKGLNAKQAGFAFVFDANSIDGTVINSVAADGIYTLSGVRVESSRLQKGIYIVNGKKVVIK